LPPGAKFARKLPLKLSTLLTTLSLKTNFDRLEQCVRCLKLEHLLDRNAFDGFSGGEARRTELLLTMVLKPKYALLDEPDSGVDVESVREVAKCINGLVESGAGVLLVTHFGTILKYLKTTTHFTKIKQGLYECSVKGL